jgi:protease-4
MADENKTDNEDKVAWERNLINRLAFASLNEQRRTRRWNIFFRTSLLLLFIIFIAVSVPEVQQTKLTIGKHTAVIKVDGVIAAATDANADYIVSGLRSAFEDKNTAGVILRINSPGGSPVQAGYVNDEIKRLRKKYPDIPLYAVISDVCASGGYYIAVAADKIFADKASLVGSIGVLMNGFGFVDALDKLGIERRLLTAGKDKGFLDPFSPLKESDKVHAQKLLDNIHQQFIDVVKTNRGEKLTADTDLYNGYIWTGEQGLELGLIDELGSSGHVAREVIKAEKIVDFTYKPDYIQRLTERLGSTIANTILTALGIESISLR